MAKKDVVSIEVTEDSFGSMIYTFRGRQVMLDSDLAAIYGYETKDFNRQVKNNIERFDEEDLMFQLNDSEVSELSRCKNSSLKSEENLRSKKLTTNPSDNLRCKNSTSSDEGWGGRRYAPYVFTEQGIYMLMTVLKGPLAVKQSKALVRLFKQMKDYIVQNQSLLGQREYLQLSLQTSDNIRDIMELRGELSKLDDKVAKVVDNMSEMVTQSQLSEVMLDFGKPAVRRGWLILNGQPVESDLAYKQIYALAKKSVFVIDNFINLKTLALMREVAEGVMVKVITDNVQNRLHKAEFEDFCREYPSMHIELLTAGGVFHDRYIVIDYGEETERIYHCGASSKDGGNKVMTITLQEDAGVYHPLIDRTLANPELELR